MLSLVPAGWWHLLLASPELLFQERDAVGSSRTVARLELHNLRVPLPSHGYLCAHFRSGGRVCCLTWGAACGAREMSCSAEPRFRILIRGVRHKSSALLRKDRVRDGDPSELVTLCDSTSHLPVVTWFGLRHSLLWLSKGLPWGT